MTRWWRHPLELFRWWYHDYDAPDWRSRLLKPFLMESAVNRITLIEQEWIEYSMDHPLATSLKVYKDWVAAGRPTEIAWLNNHPDAPSWCKLNFQHIEES